MAIVTLAETKVHLKMSGNANDAKVQGFIDAATPVIEHHVNTVAVQAFIETYDGGGSFISLRHRPITAVASITEYLGNTAYALTEAATPNLSTRWGFSVDLPTGRITRRASGGAEIAFPGGHGNVLVSYSAGRAVLPGNIRLATLELIRLWYQQGQQGGRSDFHGDAADGGEANVPMGFAVPSRVRQLLAPQRRHPSIA